jgi:hypothetical protein
MFSGWIGVPHTPSTISARRSGEVSNTCVLFDESAVSCRQSLEVVRAFRVSNTATCSAFDVSRHQTWYRSPSCGDGTIGTIKLKSAAATMVWHLRGR